MAESGGETGGRLTKVERIVDEYDLHGIEAELAERWTVEGEERQSLRDLADFFNERVLAAALERAGVETLVGDVANIYRLLMAEEVSAGQRTETRARLEQQGVDPTALESDFVSHQAVHTYLTDRRYESLPSPSDAERLEKSSETVPMMILDSLESIDAERIADLIDYFTDYNESILVALLPEDAAAATDDYTFVRDI